MRKHRAQWLALSLVSMAAGSWADHARGQLLIWDASGTNPAAPTDGSGTWSTTSVNWSESGFEESWANGSLASIGSGGTPGTITINSPGGGVTAVGVNFNAVSSGGYVIDAAAGNALTLTGGGILNMASGVTASINAPIGGTVGFTNSGAGTLNLSGSNTFTGPVAINSGTVIVNAGGNLGASTNAVSLGTTTTGGSADAVGAVIISPGVTATIGSFKSATSNTAASNTINIGAGAALNVNSTLDGTGANAVFVVGPQITNLPVATKLTVSGAGALNVTGGTNNSSFLVGLSGSNTSAAAMLSTLDMSGLANFSFVTGTGAIPVGAGGNEFAVGHGSSAQATCSFAQTTTITAGVLTVGDTGVTPGLSGGGTNVSSSQNTLNLGSVANTLNVNSMVVGNYRSLADVKWATGVTTGTLLITGAAGGTSTADISVGISSSGTPAGSASTMNLTGHDVRVQGGTVIVGWFNGGSGGNANNQARGGSISFDTGVFSAQTLELAKSTNGTGGGSNWAHTGTFNVGSNPNSTGSLNVTQNFYIASNTGGTNSPGKGVFNVRGGTANIFTNIIDKSTANATNTLLTLSGGTLNMNGFAIGPKVAAGNIGAVGTRNMSTVTFSGGTAVLANLGGTGINDAGLNLTASTATATTTLTLEGSNAYTGGTNIAVGTLQVGQSTDTSPMTLPLGAAGSTVTNNSNLYFRSGNAVTVQNVISGTGALTQAGTGLTTLSGSNTYTGVTTVTAGTLALSGSGAHTPVLNGAGGANIAGGRIVFGYAGGLTPATAVKDALTTSFASNFATGQLRSSIATSSIGLGWADDGVSQVTVRATYFGDANLDGSVNTDDFTVLSNNFGSTGVWARGDFNYDGNVNALDFNGIATNFGATLASPSLGTLVPEPSVAVLASLVAMGCSRRRRSQ